VLKEEKMMSDLEKWQSLIDHNTVMEPIEIDESKLSQF
jgi:hypothetical protein